MMMRSLLLKTIYDKRWFIVGWAAAIGLMAAFVVAFFPSFKEGDTFRELTSAIPEQMKGLVGDIDSFRFLPNYLAVQLYDIRMPLFVMILALVLATGLSVTQEEKGHVRTILGMPLSRTRVLLETWLAGIIIIALIIALTTALVYGSVLLINEAPPHELILRLNLMLWFYAVAAFSIPFAAGYATGQRSVTLAVGLIVTIGGFLFSTFAAQVDWLRTWETLSLMHYYDTSALLEGRFNGSDLWFLGLLTVVSLLLAAVFFRRRDVA